ncbi:MAG: glycosyltransferase [Pseudobdellovibrionaceae bacterium]|nr:glycosyltransferase [Pseudobdellovibrionaceae bacterium]
MEASPKLSNELKLAVMIPCFNEEVTVSKVVNDFRKALPNAVIYVFDNNSTDRTAQLARAAGALVIKEPRQGKGYVVQKMFSEVEADIYVMVDGDDTYPADAVQRLIAPILNNQADMVVGSRFQKFEKNAFRPFHEFGNWLVRTLVNLIFNANLTDILSGYRAFNRSIVKGLPIVSQGFEVETEMVMQALYYRYKIIEIPVEYRARPPGSYSKLNTIKDGVLVLKTLINVAKTYKPLLVFFSLGAVFAGSGLILGLIPIWEFIQTGKVQRFPTAILATGLVLISIICWVTGIILDSINYRFLEVQKLLAAKNQNDRK